MSDESKKKFIKRAGLKFVSFNDPADTWEDDPKEKSQEAFYKSKEFSKVRLYRSKHEDEGDIEKEPWTVYVFCKELKPAFAQDEDMIIAGVFPCQDPHDSIDFLYLFQEHLSFLKVLVLAGRVGGLRHNFEKAEKELEELEDQISGMT